MDLCLSGLGLPVTRPLWEKSIPCPSGSSADAPAQGGDTRASEAESGAAGKIPAHLLERSKADKAKADTEKAVQTVEEKLKEGY